MGQNFRPPPSPKLQCWYTLVSQLITTLNLWGAGFSYILIIVLGLIHRGLFFAFTGLGVFTFATSRWIDYCLRAAQRKTNIFVLIRFGSEIKFRFVMVWKGHPTCTQWSCRIVVCVFVLYAGWTPDTRKPTITLKTCENRCENRCKTNENLKTS